MDRAAFIEKWRHEMAGLVLDGCAVHRTGAEFALFARQIMHKVDQRLGQMYDQLNPKPAAPTNGTAAQPVRTK
jgi:hypothetical protein